MFRQERSEKEPAQGVVLRAANYKSTNLPVAGLPKCNPRSSRYATRHPLRIPPAPIASCAHKGRRFIDNTPNSIHAAIKLPCHRPPRGFPSGTRRLKADVAIRIPPKPSPKGKTLGHGFPRRPYGLLGMKQKVGTCSYRNRRKQLANFCVITTSSRSS